VLVIRILGLLVAIAVGVSLLLWLGTGDRKWLRYAWNLFRVALVAVAVFLVLLFGERLLVL
jgi:ABC-type dipeptide/oligopeptide/nickel transport system permease component